MIHPLTSEVNFTPTSIDEPSDALGFAGVADAGQIVHAAQLAEDGVTALEADDAAPVPTALVADTVNV